jgi:hypothetical protein
LSKFTSQLQSDASEVCSLILCFYKRRCKMKHLGNGGKDACIGRHVPNSEVFQWSGMSTKSRNDQSEITTCIVGTDTTVLRLKAYCRLHCDFPLHGSSM